MTVLRKISHSYPLSGSSRFEVHFWPGIPMDIRYIPPNQVVPTNFPMHFLLACLENDCDVASGMPVTGWELDMLEDLYRTIRSQGDLAVYRGYHHGGHAVVPGQPDPWHQIDLCPSACGHPQQEPTEQEILGCPEIIVRQCLICNRELWWHVDQWKTV